MACSHDTNAERGDPVADGEEADMKLIRMAVLLTGLPAVVVWAASAAFEATFIAASDVDLGNPHDIKLSPDGRHLFVSDVDNDRVVVLDADTLALVDAFGADHQNGTHDVDFDAQGRLYVADTHNHRVGIYRLDGTRGALVGELKGKLSKPEGVLVHPNGRVYVTGAGSGNIVAFAGDKAVAQAGGLSAPHDIELAPNGDLWIADAGNDRLVRMTPELEVVALLDDRGYAFAGPRYLDVLADGTLIVADKYAHSVKVIAPDGRLVATLGDGRAGRGPAKFRTPEGVEVRGDTLWIADSGNDRIVKYRFKLGDS